MIERLLSSMSGRARERHAPIHPPLDAVNALTSPDGFDVLDVCHRQTLFMMGKLAALISRLMKIGNDEEARSMASEISIFFSTTARQHHEDEERHIFPKLAAFGDRDTVSAVLRLQQDHDWLEENWMDLSPHLDAVACGQSWYDLDILREGATTFAARLHSHIALEATFIYPQARAQFPATERLEMGREMATRRRDEREAEKAAAG